MKQTEWKESCVDGRKTGQKGREVRQVEWNRKRTEWKEIEEKDVMIRSVQLL